MVDIQAISTTQPLRWVLPCPRGTEEVLAQELLGLALDAPRVEPTAVHVRASLQEGYRVALWSRVASRVLLPLARWQGDDADSAYTALREVPWEQHFTPQDTFAIGHSVAARSNVPAHFWVQRAKDAIVDSFRDRTGTRPSIDKKAPAIRFHLHIGQGEHELALDFSGHGHHRRGYRHAAGAAPLKENLAAAILYLAGWPRAAEEGLTLVDPACGSGTLLIEAALIATQCAPGLLRDAFGFERWLLHDARLYEQERVAAKAKRTSRIQSKLVGYDASATALKYVQENVRSAGVADLVTLESQSISAISKPSERGIVVCNPPYGHRLGDDSTVFLFYQALGDALKQSFDGWTAYIFAAHNDNLKHIGLKPASRHVLYNGAIECRLLEIPIHESNVPSGRPSWRTKSQSAEMFENRARKNLRKWGRWAQREEVECYRLYDADIPEYNVAIDRYPSKALVHVYPRSSRTDDAAARQRLQDVLLTLPAVLELQPEDLIVKVRHRQGEGDQYLRLAEQGEELIVGEGPLCFLVNLQDRIDTGLFLDHRKVRAYAMKHSEGKRVLNLFAYTCSVSVAAAAGGATQTTSVDLSNTYLDWGRRNFKENQIDPQLHRFVRDDAVRWMGRARDTYDWIFINPPTFSRSKMTKEDFNVHRHHGRLIDHAMGALSRKGELLFTTHARDFRLDAPITKKFRVEEAAKTFVPADFARSPFSAFVISHTQ